MFQASANSKPQSQAQAQSFKEQFSGVWVPLVTPFHKGVPDYDAAAKLARYLTDLGIDGLVLCSTTGEGPALLPYEKARLIDRVTTSVAGDIPILMGIEGANTAKIIAEIQELGDSSISGLLAPPPSYVRPDPPGLAKHFLSLADAFPLPIMLYDIPARTGVSLSIDMVASLSATGNFPAIKACGLTDDRARALLGIEGLAVLSGDDAFSSRLLELGGHGAVMATAQVVPHLVCQAFRDVKRLGPAAAQGALSPLLPLISLMFRQANPGPVKAALAIQGWIRDELRCPMTSVSEELRNAIREALDEIEGSPLVYETGTDHRNGHCPDKSWK